MEPLDKKTAQANLLSEKLADALNEVTDLEIALSATSMLLARLLFVLPKPGREHVAEGVTKNIHIYLQQLEEKYPEPKNGAG